IAVGIGIFITFIGLVNLGLVVKNDATIVSMGAFSATVLIGLFGLVIMLILEAKKVKGSLLIGILAATLAAILAGYVKLPSSFFLAN
ncbi:guanine permease, partial [Candidatus Roizmanbacteria bacterium CG10_big_fil_rev_8_21_14_0_10_39_12]